MFSKQYWQKTSHNYSHMRFYSQALPCICPARSESVAQPQWPYALHDHCTTSHSPEIIKIRLLKYLPKIGISNFWQNPELLLKMKSECNSKNIHVTGTFVKSTRQIWGIWKLRPAYSPETPNLGQNRWCFVPCDLEIWWMTLENNRAPLLCCFKLCATFHSHRWIQTGVAVRQSAIWVKFNDFSSRVTLTFDVWPWKRIGHLYYATSSSMHHFVAIGEFKLKLQSGNAQFGSKSMIFLAVWPCHLTHDLEKQ